MPDEVLNIRVTEAELDLITCLLEQAGTMEDSNGQPAFELLHDLMEQAARPGEWNDPEDPDLFMDPIDFAAKHDIEPDQIVICDAEINAETQMFNAGVEAREQMKERNRLMDLLDSQGGRSIELAEQIDQLDAQMKASSRAAERRALNFSAARDDGDLSETQKHDLWEKPSNDPVDW